MLKPFFIRGSELSGDQGAVMWKYRVVVPLKIRDQFLIKLHSIYERISKIKASERVYFWWTSLDRDIEKVVKNCRVFIRQRLTLLKRQLYLVYKQGIFLKEFIYTF